MEHPYRAEAGAVRRNETMRWVRVAVDAHTDYDGAVTPKVVYWTDGRAFDVDEVVERGRAYGDERERWWYLLRIGAAWRELWWDNPGWHVLVAPGTPGSEPPHYGRRLR